MAKQRLPGPLLVGERREQHHSLFTDTLLGLPRQDKKFLSPSNTSTRVEPSVSLTFDRLKELIAEIDLSPQAEFVVVSEREGNGGSRLPRFYVERSPNPGVIADEIERLSTQGYQSKIYKVQRSVGSEAPRFEVPHPPAWLDIAIGKLGVLKYQLDNKFYALQESFEFSLDRIEDEYC